MNASLTKKMARRIVWAMNMKPGETLSVRGGTHEQELVEEIALIAMEQGVSVSLSTSSDYFAQNFYKRTPLKYLRQTPKLSMKIIEALDNTIGLERPKDPRVLSNIPHERIGAAIEGGQAVSKKMDRYSIKWCFVGFPSHELAAQLGVPYSKLKRFIVDAMLMDYKRLVEKAGKIRKRLENAEYVRITDEHGSNLTLKLVNRKILIDDGYISDEDKRHGDVGLNLPAGEVFTTPLETYAEGVLVSPKRRDLYTEKMVEDIKLVFEKGRLNMNKSCAEKNWEAMKKSIRHSMAIDRKNFKTLRTTNVAELGIGLNPIITEIIGYLLTDEKVGGTVHVAIGKNKTKSYGGRSNSSIHWDFTTHKGVTLEVTDMNKRTVPILEKGRFVS